ncbi:unnamed protein product [Blepharisma stoltei]|uniref:Uncharacterized protein n=1 Tax=Blepharisma stoltei TaxID=1481888 RepID=A0AAU9J130_9CILI|nr:unnamed protein product [Blepharisma stoltei]
MLGNFEIPSPTLIAPNCSEVSSELSLSPLREESKELNTLRLQSALLKLKKNHNYKDPPTDIKLEQSIDGSCKIYVRNTNYNHDNSSEPTCTPSLNEPQELYPTELEQIINRLRKIAEARNSESISTPPTPTQCYISLDHCSIVYFPENAEVQETSEQYENLPSSKDTQTPNVEPKYNLKCPQTLRFIQRALMSCTSISSLPRTPDDIVQESIDRSIIIIHPREINDEGFRPALSRHNSSHNYRVTSISRHGAEDLSLPEAIQTLKKKLEELSIDDCSEQAIDDENIRIITVEYSPSSSPGSISSIEQSTPVIKSQEYPDLLSPETRFKLMRKLHAVQEDMEGEEENIREIDESTVIYTNEEENFMNNARSEANSAASPVYHIHIEPSLNAVAERLRKLRSDSETPEDY